MRDVVIVARNLLVKAILEMISHMRILEFIRKFLVIVFLVLLLFLTIKHTFNVFSNYNNNPVKLKLVYHKSKRVIVFCIV